MEMANLLVHRRDDGGSSSPADADGDCTFEPDAVGGDNFGNNEDDLYGDGCSRQCTHRSC